VREETPPTLSQALEEGRILVVGGSGGVGKTTTAAAVALQAALGGRRVLVCTIDPSRRLVTSLGLQSLRDKPGTLNIARLGPAEGGSLSAMMLDVKSTFDALVERYGGSPEARARILNNRFYQELSAALAGSHEYMAMEKLLELSQDPRFDLIVLDTPPTRHALDFLEAPERLMGFMDTSVLRWFIKPYFVAGRLTIKIATRTGAFALRLADRVLGIQFLQDVSEFFLAFEGMYDGFKARAAEVFELLRAPGSSFLLVSSPQPASLDEALFFHARLQERRMPLVGVVVNRVHPEPVPVRRGRARRSGAAAELEPEFVDRLLRVFEEQQVVSRQERIAISRLQEQTTVPVVLVPELESDVHDLRGLKRVGELVLPGFYAERAGTRRRDAEDGR
jgi:anion-transporting  ArsA/GET3 family ATPase